MNKVMECKICGVAVPKVDPKTEEVTCYMCIFEMLSEANESTSVKKVKGTKEGYPKGWRFMKEFVHSNGTVYHKGIEQPDLKGKVDATVIEVKPKKTKQQREEEKAKALVEYNNLKKALKKETRKTIRKKLESKLKRLQKQIV
jgi:hypothetical protein